MHASLCLSGLLDYYLLNVSNTGVTFPYCIALMIMMNKTVMILREGKMGGIIMMMKVIIVATYLRRADVSGTVTAPLHHPHGRKLSFPQTRPNVRARSRSHKHRLRFIRWLAATARHSSRQLAADARELLTITPTAPPLAPLPVSSLPVSGCSTVS